MSFTIDWHPNVRKYLRKLPKESSTRIVEKIQRIKDNPFHYLEHLESKKLYKLRIGNFRALIDANLSTKSLKV